MVGAAELVAGAEVAPANGREPQDGTAGMSGSVGASRKHGPFDTRWSSASERSAGAVSTVPPLRAAEAAEALDWEAFSNRYFPGRRRHDMEALTAYATYKQGREWRTTPARLIDAEIKLKLRPRPGLRARFTRTARRAHATR